MSFISPLFLVCLLLVVLLNRLIPALYRPRFLLFVSLLFIGFFSIGSLLAVVFFSCFTFYIARAVPGNRPLFLVGVLLHAAAIILFNFFSLDQSGLSFQLSDVPFSLGSFILALGISFYSLQNIAYLREVHYHRMSPEKSITGFLLYNSFFPKIISGPVMLPAEFLPNAGNAEVTQDKLISGFQRFLLGLFKKLVIADRLAPAVASVFDHNDDYPGLTVAAAAYLFTIQLYFDFSGYTDMAIGAARMLGYDLKENFRQPFRSGSVAEFWRRWHISLISWFTQYVYYPVVYKFRSMKKMAALLGIALTFLISAAWHGIGLGFLIWGACHAIYLGFELLTKKQRIRLSGSINPFTYKVLSAFLVFNAVCFSHIFFRAGSAETAFRLSADLFSGFLPADWLRDFLAPLAVGGHQQDLFNFYITLFFAALLLIFERRILAVIAKPRISVLFICASILLIFVFGALGDASRFIYMQF